uniref:Uncharacterized protein n=1 Tax=Chrysotila carterae TaxID=13221 RepID=A0A7S4C6D9_CHRCT
MLAAQKSSLEANVRQRLVAIRERELEYYTDNCRHLGDLGALLAGLAFSGIRYHYLLERQHSWMVQEGDALEEVIFLSLLTITLGCGLQTVLIAMLVAMLGPSLALRGPDGSLHDAVCGMQVWNSLMLALFMTSLVMLQLSALSFIYGHKQLGFYCRSLLLGVNVLTIVLTFHYSRMVLRLFRIPHEIAVSGAFFDEFGRRLDPEIEDLPRPRQRFGALSRRCSQLRSRFSSVTPHETHEAVGLLPPTHAQPDEMDGADDRLAADADHDELDAVLDETLHLASEAFLEDRGGAHGRSRGDGMGRAGGWRQAVPLAARLVRLLLGEAPVHKQTHDGAG